MVISGRIKPSGRTGRMEESPFVPAPRGPTGEDTRGRPQRYCMPVQLHSSRARQLLVAAVFPLLAVGCAQPKPETETPALEEKEAELAQLRRENAALETEVQNLEERIRLLERSGSTSLGTSFGFE